MRRFLFLLLLHCGATAQQRTIFFGTEPVGAHIIIHGVDRGITPLAFVCRDSLDCTPFDALIRKSGSVPRSVTVTDRSDTVFCALTPAATLIVYSVPDTAAVFINGALFGRTPAHIDTIPAGVVSVTTVKKFFQPNTMQLTLSPSETTTVSPILVRQEMSVSITANDPTAQIMLDDTPVGTGRADSVTVLMARHRWTVTDPVSGASAHLSFIASPSSPKRFHAELRQFSWAKTVSGILFPGTAQATDGVWYSGIPLIVSSAGAAAYAISTSMSADKDRSAYDAALKAYESARYATTIVTARTVLASSHDALEHKARQNTLAFIGCAVLWGVNAVDVLLNHTMSDEIMVIAATEHPILSQPSRSFALQFSIPF